MHPSSGVLKTVSATTGVRHGNGTVTSCLRGLIWTGHIWWCPSVSITGVHDS